MVPFFLEGISHKALLRDLDQLPVVSHLVSHLSYIYTKSLSEVIWKSLFHCHQQGQPQSRGDPVCATYMTVAAAPHPASASPSGQEQSLHIALRYNIKLLRNNNHYSQRRRWAISTKSEYQCASRLVIETGNRRVKQEMNRTQSTLPVAGNATRVYPHFFVV